MTCVAWRGCSGVPKGRGEAARFLALEFYHVPVCFHGILALEFYHEPVCDVSPLPWDDSDRSHGVAFRVRGSRILSAELLGGQI